MNPKVLEWCFEELKQQADEYSKLREHAEYLKLRIGYHEAMIKAHREWCAKHGFETQEAP